MMTVVCDKPESCSMDHLCASKFNERLQRGRMFTRTYVTFALWYEPSVCRLSVVCNLLHGQMFELLHHLIA